MRALLDAQTGDGNPIDPDALFNEGDRVTLVEGPMKGLSAIVQA
jgi:transcription antitermination factor NusG